MRDYFVATTLIVIFILPLPSHAQRSAIPNATLRVTVQTRQRTGSDRRNLLIWRHKIAE
jgi:hypothetical protein